MQTFEPLKNNIRGVLLLILILPFLETNEGGSVRGHGSLSISLCRRFFDPGPLLRTCRLVYVLTLQ